MWKEFLRESWLVCWFGLITWSFSSNIRGEEAKPQRSLIIGELRCEHASDPLGIDTNQPRLDWALESKGRGVEPKAYRVLIATSPALLSKDQGDQWDSGEVESSETLGIVPTGKPLKSATRYWWKVKEWDNSNAQSAWSAPAWFETGLLSPTDWSGGWIGTGKRDPTVGFDFKPADWIWFPEKESVLSEYPSGKRWFTRGFTLPDNDPVIKATLMATADNRMNLWVNGVAGGSSDSWDHPLFTDITSLLKSGTNQISIQAENTGKGYAGLLVAIKFVAKSGKSWTLYSDSAWNAFDRSPVGWPIVRDLGIKGTSARFLGPYGMEPWAQLDIPLLETTSLISAPLFRKEFQIPRPVSSARLYICGLGLYEAHLNGQGVSDKVLEPVQSRYDKRAYYSIYDVSGMLKTGPNVLGVELGRGFFSIRENTPWNWKNAPWTQPPALKAQLKVWYQDGSSDVIATDGSWKMNLDGPTLNDSMYWGEIYDARRELPGWTEAGSSDAGWEPVENVAAPTSNLHVSTIPPMRVVQTSRPISVTSPKPHVFVFDVGFVTAGWAKLKASAPPGTAVTIRYSERLSNDGTAAAIHFNGENGPGQTDVYVFKGQGTEEWAPKFSYKGFKYVEVAGMPTPLTIDNLEIQIVHNDVKTVGSFSCSNPLFNKIHDVMVRTMLNNFQGKPTDTPTYEKNGWMGDANVTLETMFYNFDVTSFLEKWTDDIFDSQNDQGQIAVINPTGGWGTGFSPVWDSACFFVPWHLWQYAGDPSTYQKYRPAIKRYLDGEISILRDGVCTAGGLGDWSSPGTDTARRRGCAAPEGAALAKTAYLLRCLELYDSVPNDNLSAGDSAPYAQTVAQMRAAFDKHFLDPATGVYHTDIPTELRQTSQILPLYFGWTPPETREATFNALVGDIHQRGDHLDTGLIGTKYLLPLLTECKQGELAYKIADQQTNPSWGFWLANGATTMWETWELHPRSNDHYFLGTVDEWFYKYLAGINEVKDGFKSFTIEPYVLADLTSAKATITSPRGLVASAWQRAMDGRITLNVSIPPGCSATIGMPVSGSEDVTESGKTIDPGSTDIRFLRREPGHCWYRIASGNYEFQSQYDKPAAPTP